MAKESYETKLKRTDHDKWLIYKAKKADYQRAYCKARPKYKVGYYHRTKNKPTYIKRYLLKHAKARAAKKGIEFTLTENDIVIPNQCPIMGVPFDKSNRRFSYSLDRIDPTQGYTPTNIWVISQIANAMKWDSTADERKRFAEWIQTGEKRG